MRDENGSKRTRGKTATWGLLFLAVTAILAFCVIRSQEPVYEGRPLRAWLADIDYGQPEAVRERAEEALRNMGTNALPILIEDLAYRDSNFKKFLERTANLQPWIQVRFRNPTERYIWATVAIQTLGPTARPAGPALLELFETNPIYAVRAYAALGPESIPALSRALVHPDRWVRWNAASVLKDFGPQAREATPHLRLGLEDADPSVREQMRKALRQVDPSPLDDSGLLDSRD